MNHSTFRRQYRLREHGSVGQHLICVACLRGVIEVPEEEVDEPVRRHRRRHRNAAVFVLAKCQVESRVRQFLMVPIRSVVVVADREWHNVARDNVAVDLFSDRFVDSELGEIPEGWEVTPLSECVDVARGLSYKGSGLSSDGLPTHNLNSVYEGGGYKHDGLKGYDGEQTFATLPVDANVKSALGEMVQAT